MTAEISVIKGNLFTSKCQTLVNTVNTQGVMGAGIALEFKLRYPEMFQRYQELCKKNMMSIGKLWLYKSPEKWVLNFPTKMDWKKPSRVEYLTLGLEKFLMTYRGKGISSIAFPLLGAQHGKLSPEKSLTIMKKYLGQCGIPVEIYIYDPNAEDDLLSKLKSIFLDRTEEEVKSYFQISTKICLTIKYLLEENQIKSISALSKKKGIGLKSVEKIFLGLQQF